MCLWVLFSIYVTTRIQASRATWILLSTLPSRLREKLKRPKTLGQQEKRSRGLSFTRRTLFICFHIWINQEPNDTGAHSILFRAGPGFNLLFLLTDESSTFGVITNQRKYFLNSSPKRGALKTTVVFDSTWELHGPLRFEQRFSRTV